MASIHINLTTEHRGGISSTSFSGRPEGEHVRETFSLDEKDTDDNEYIIDIPSGTSAFNPSFFLGLLFPSIKKLGIGKFVSKYRFGLENLSPALKSLINDDIQEGLRNASNEMSLSTGLDF